MYVVHPIHGLHPPNYHAMLNFIQNNRLQSQELCFPTSYK